MKKEIIIINGTGASGKDTFVEFTQKYEKVYNFSSIDVIKELAKIAGWTGTKTEKDRKFLSDLKKLTTDYNDLAFHSIKDAIAYFKSSECEANVMFIHIREPEEIKKAVEAFGSKTLLIRRSNHEIITSNYSDANVENYPYDYIIENTTLNELEQNAKEFITNTIKNTTRKLTN